MRRIFSLLNVKNTGKILLIENAPAPTPLVGEPTHLSGVGLAQS